MIHDIWVEVSKEALINNYKSLKSYVNEKAKFCCVLKANAYGHDLVQTAKILSEENCDYFGLTHIDEALLIRKADIKTPILLFLPVTETRIKEAIKFNLDLTVGSIFDAQNINKVAENLNIDAHIHVKIDTGMGRIGVLQSEVYDLFDYIKQCPRLKVTGTYTHFTNSGSINIKYTYKQFNQFQNITNFLHKRGYETGMLHCSNSAATVRFPNMQLDMVRCGTILFGQFPSVYSKNENINLEVTWKLKARVVAIRNIPSGHTIGYGSEYTTKNNTKCAVVACGFAHGLTMIPESLIYRIEPLRYFVKKWTRKIHVYINNETFNVLGRVSMQMIVIDITKAKNEIKVNDEVVIPCMRLPVDSSIPRIFK